MMTDVTTPKYLDETAADSGDGGLLGNFFVVLSMGLVTISAVATALHPGLPLMLIAAGAISFVGIAKANQPQPAFSALAILTALIAFSCVIVNGATLLPGFH